jgi:multiple antibiotic resistance protein
MTPLIEYNTFQHFLIGLLAIGNNISAIGAFLIQTKGLPRAQVQRMIVITSAASLAMLLLFMQFGTTVLGFFGISISAFQIAGGILLGGVGLDMMNARLSNDVDIKAVDSSLIERQGLDKAQLYASAVVPIAIPLTVGAGTFSAVILFADIGARTGSQASLFCAILALVGLNYLVFQFSSRIVKFVGEVGLSVFTKIMGLFTLAIGVEFIVRGLTTIYRHLQR